MLCKFSLLRRKEVINLCDGCRLGCVGDVEVTVPEGSVKALIVFGPCRFFGLFGRGEFHANSFLFHSCSFLIRLVEM